MTDFHARPRCNSQKEWTYTIAIRDDEHSEIGELTSHEAVACDYGWAPCAGTVSNDTPRPISRCKRRCRCRVFATLGCTIRDGLEA